MTADPVTGRWRAVLFVRLKQGGTTENISVPFGTGIFLCPGPLYEIASAAEAVWIRKELGIRRDPMDERMSVHETTD